MNSSYRYRRLDKADAAVLLVDHQSGLCNIVEGLAQPFSNHLPA